MEITKTYNPKDHESQIYEKWENSGFFNPDNLNCSDKAENYCISMPPPNVTGVLHLGHALENAIMDIEVRYQRMNGKRAVLVPGTDHAAVATQAKVEKELVSEGIKNPRDDLGRDELLKRIREYAENSKSTIIKQIKKMGTSCDWDRLAYTFDKERSTAVNEVFFRMFNDKLIYKGYRVINWSVKGQSTCSDDELVHKEQKTILYTFQYSKNFPISVSTTRPETKLGDTAVAVHPDDKRYKKYIGKTYTVDVGASKQLEIKIIADKEVDPEFGTGAIGVTPAHSQIDFEMYEKHKLNLIQVIDSRGNMTEKAGKQYAGLSTLKARDKFVSWLKGNNLMLNEEEILHSVGTSDRFGDVVEALPMEQWFVAVNRKIPGRGKTLKDLMREAVVSGHAGDKNKIIDITPERFKIQYLHWIDNLRDWCISRQVWWGHRIPVWYRGEEIFAGTEKPEGDGWVQEEDTLDTWFSSGTWTFSTLGWPKRTADLKNYHPTAWMQMGYEILFFWMARMILMTTYALDDIPFQKVYFHGMLRDKNGQKFSKSLGNGIDPIDMANQYGTDALRLSLVLGTTPGNDSRFYEEKIESSRNFVNKLWNISRYILQKDKSERHDVKILASDLSISDKAILQEMRNLIKETSVNLASNNFSRASEGLKDFTRNFFADWYLEASKFDSSQEKDKVLVLVLKDLLKLWHPFMPFVSEKIWGQFNETLLISEKWPSFEDYDELLGSSDETELQAFSKMQTIISLIRNARAEYKIEPSKKIDVVIYAGKQVEILRLQKKLISSLRTGIDQLKIEKSGERIPKSIYVSLGEVELYIPLEGIVDFDKEKTRLQEELTAAVKYSDFLRKKLENTNFVENAPDNIIENTKTKLLDSKEKIKKIKEYLINLE